MNEAHNAVPETAPVWYELDAPKLESESLHDLCFSKGRLNLNEREAVELGIHAPVQHGSRQGRTVTARIRAIPEKRISSPQRVPKNSPLVTAAHGSTENAHPAIEYLEESGEIEAAKTLAPATVFQSPPQLPTPEGYNTHSAYHGTSAVGTAIQNLRRISADVYLQVLIISMEGYVAKKSAQKSPPDRDHAPTPPDSGNKYAVGVTACVRTASASPTGQDSDADTIADQALDAFSITGKQRSLLKLPLTPDGAAKRLREPRFKPYGTRLLNVLQVLNITPTGTIDSLLPIPTPIRGVPGKVKVCEDDLEWLLGSPPESGDRRTR